MTGKHVAFDRYLPFALVAAGNAISSGASRAYLARFGLGVTEWRVLANLKAGRGMTANSIAASSRLDKAAVSRAVAGLIAAGYVAATLDDGDRRKRPLRLTDTGNALHDRMLEVALERQRALLEGFSEEETTALLDYLGRLLGNATRLDEG